MRFCDFFDLPSPRHKTRVHWRRQFSDSPAGLSSWNVGVDYACFYAGGIDPDQSGSWPSCMSTPDAWMAQAHGVRFIPHGWNTAIGLAADLQLASAFHDTDLVEYLTGSPFIDAITVGGWRLDRDGMLPIPDSPGLGVRLDPDEVAKYTGGEQLF